MVIMMELHAMAFVVYSIFLTLHLPSVTTMQSSTAAVTGTPSSLLLATMADAAAGALFGDDNYSFADQDDDSADEADEGVAGGKGGGGGGGKGQQGPCLYCGVESEDHDGVGCTGPCICGYGEDGRRDRLKRHQLARAHTFFDDGENDGNVTCSVCFHRCPVRYSLSTTSQDYFFFLFFFLRGRARLYCMHVDVVRYINAIKHALD